jgi:hypothetical protein
VLNLPLIESKPFLNRELGNLDPELLLASATKMMKLHRLHFEDEFISIDFDIVPKKPEACGRPDARNIGMLPIRTRRGDSKETIRRTLHAKAKHYGKIGEPFVIAVNTLGPWEYDKDEQLETLFGTRQEYVPWGNEELRVRYLKDGFWGNADSPKYTRVSAVIFGCALPWNIPRIDFMLYRNPWAKHPLPSGYWKLATMDFSQNKIIKTYGNVTVGNILGLPPDWPGDLFPERRR